MLALPEFTLVDDLARVALLKARLVDAPAAVELHEMALRMARHAAAAPLFICRLVGVSMEVKGITSIAAMLPQWDPVLRDRLAATMANGLPPARTISECAVMEGQVMSAWYSRVFEEEVKKSGATLDVKAWLEGLVKEASENLDTKLKQRGQSRSSLPEDVAGMRRMIQEYRAQMVELARIVALPRAAMNDAARLFEQKLKAAPRRNFFTETMKPIVMNARERELKLASMLALSRAAFDVQAKGQSALPAGLATYRKTAGGFELTGKELFNGKPVVLTVGPKA
jgi:hypothetical protein